MECKLFRVGVVILNYNGLNDTLACAESVLASTQPPDWLVIVDNASTDDSRHWLSHWARGNLEFVLPEQGVVKPQAKPLPFIELEEGMEAEIQPLVLLYLRRNGGYAAGMNSGMRLLLRFGADAIWLLNNDTIVEKNALGAMVQRLFSKSRPGLCGSLLRYTDSGLVQCQAGGYTNRWFGLSTLEGNGSEVHDQGLLTPEAVEERLDFICGASVMASRVFIETVGLMDERYFLYCEEQDWANSANGRFDFAFAPDAIVWHKEGTTTGFSHNQFNLRRALNLVRSRLLLTAKHNPAALPTVCLGIAYAVVLMFWRRVVKKHNSYAKKAARP